MQFLDWIERVDRWLVVPEKILLFLLFLVLIGVISIQVVARYWLFIPTPWAEEIARFSFIWITYVGASVATFHRDHIAIDLAHPLYRTVFRMRNPVFVERMLIAINFILVVPFLFIFSDLSLTYLSNALRLNQYSPAANIPMYVPIFAVVLGSITMLIHAIADTIRGIRDPRLPEEEPAQ